MTDSAVVNASATKLATSTGLNASFLKMWLTAENGFANNNPLGLRDYSAGAPSTHPLIVFPTLDAGLTATANLINTAPQYAGIRATRGGTVQQQALAVIASPWNVPNSPYYKRMFAGVLGGAVPPTTTDTGNTGVVPGTLSATFTQLKPTYLLDQTTINLLMGEVPVDNPNRSDILAGLTSKIGTPINQVKMPTSWNVTPTGGWQNFWGGQAGTSGSGGGLGNSGIIAPDVPGALASLGSTATSIATYLAALLVVALGVFLYSKGGRGQEAQGAPTGD
jgi:hypothetical protein